MMLRPTLAVAAILGLAAPAAASTYSAKPANPAQSARVIERDIVWTCTASGCVGKTDKSRPLVLCQGLARKTGPIESFTVDGRALAAGELDRCNASARGDSTGALAAN
jgi:hypothetical protein